MKSKSIKRKIYELDAFKEKRIHDRGGKEWGALQSIADDVGMSRQLFRYRAAHDSMLFYISEDSDGTLNSHLSSMPEKSAITVDDVRQSIKLGGDHG